MLVLFSLLEVLYPVRLFVVVRFVGLVYSTGFLYAAVLLTVLAGRLIGLEVRPRIGDVLLSFYLVQHFSMQVGVFYLLEFDDALVVIAGFFAIITVLPRDGRNLFGAFQEVSFHGCWWEPGGADFVTLFCGMEFDLSLKPVAFDPTEFCGRPLPLHGHPHVGDEDACTVHQRRPLPRRGRAATLRRPRRRHGLAAAASCSQSYTYW